MSVPVTPQGAAALWEKVDFKTTQLKADSDHKLSYTDENGRAFNLSVGFSTKVTHTTYDRQAGSISRGEGKAPLRGLRLGHLNQLQYGRDSAWVEVVDRFRQLIAEFTSHHAPKPTIGGTEARYVEEHVEVLEVETELTVEMDNVDMEYWSVENTAGRLVDFALSLYQGGDKQEHVDKMMTGLDQGFEEAKAAFGGALPDISQQTVDLAKERLTQWATKGEVELTA